EVAGPIEGRWWIRRPHMLEVRPRVRARQVDGSSSAVSEVAWVHGAHMQRSRERCDGDAGGSGVPLAQRRDRDGTAKRLGRDESGTVHIGDRRVATAPGYRAPGEGIPVGGSG